MGNIIDYINWRKDITFAERPFNIVDNLVFSYLGYLDISDIYQKGQKISLREIWNRLGTKAKFKYLSADGSDIEALKACALSERFGNIEISDYEDYTNFKENQQFAAMTFCISDDDAVVVFRGTDETIIGWKEDFMLSYTKVPSQDKALSYCKKVIPGYKRCYIAGHSKGANLALYSAAHMDDEELSHVEKIFLNDGPGFCREVFDLRLIERVEQKCVKITPQYCVVGAFFEPSISENYIVKSTGVQLLQHGIITWEVGPDGLETADDHDISSERINVIFDKFIEKMDKLSDRQTFVDSIFDTMIGSGAVTIDDFVKEGPLAFENLVFSVISGENDGSNPLKNVKDNIACDIKNSDIAKKIAPTKEHTKLYQILITALVGILCLTIPKSFIETTFAILMFIVVAIGVILTVYHLFKNSWDFNSEKLRINTSIVLIVAYSIIIIKDGALFLFSSILIGSFFWSRCYQFVEKYKEYKNVKPLRYRYMVEAILTFIFGGYLLVAPKVGIEAYTISCGSFFILDSFFEIVSFFRNHYRA